MKIVVINNIYPPYHRGGAEQVVVKTVEGLRRAGHEVVILTSSPDGELYEQKDGVRIYRTKPRNVYFYTDAHKHFFVTRFLWHLIDIFNVGTSSWVKEILKNEKPDVVHTHNLLGLSFLIPHSIRQLGFRHVHTVHDVQLVEPSAMILKEKETSWRYTGLPTKIYTWLMKHLMGSPDIVISPSQFLLDFYSSRGFFKESKRVLVRNPATFDFNVRAPDVVRGGSFRFLYLGQIEYHKGVDLLVKTFLKTRIQAQLHIVGSGSELENITTLSKEADNVVVHGRKERSELPALFAATDMTIVPSLCYENSPTVIFESLHFGVPVLASDIEGIAELISEGQNGLTFEAGNADSLMKKMKWAVSHPEKIHAMDKRSPHISGAESYIDRLEELYGSEGV